MLLFFILAALAYGAASFAFGAGSGADTARKWGRGALAIAAVMQIGTIGGQCIGGNHPFRSVFLVTSLITLLVVIGYLALSARGREMRALGASMGPVGLVGLALGVFMGPGEVVAPAEASTGLLLLHIGFAALGVAGFGLSAGVAGLYLALDRRLRNKKIKPGRSGLSLKSLERLQYWLVLGVVPVFTVSIVAGVIALRGRGDELLDTRGLELIAAAIAWLSSVMSVVARAAWGIRGRRAAWLSILAFVSMLLILVSYGLRG
jgi:ABC-type uncharacterized transport system permease subunit